MTSPVRSVLVPPERTHEVISRATWPGPLKDNGSNKLVSERHESQEGVLKWSTIAINDLLEEQVSARRCV